MIDAGVPADAGADEDPAKDPAAEIGVSLADLRSARDGVVEMIQTQRAVLERLAGRLAAFNALIEPLEAELRAES